MASRLSFRMHSTLTQDKQLTGLMERFTSHPHYNDRVTLHYILSWVPPTPHTHTHTHIYINIQRERERERGENY